MRFIQDWKYAITLVVAIAGVAAPVWLWRADLNSKALSITLSSQTAIVPPASAQVGGIEVKYKGDRISDPYLSLVEIKNSGSKPIAASDIESPIQIRLEPPTKLRAATIAEKSPKGFDPKIDFTDVTVSLRPALINPEDRVVLAIVTSEKPPSLTATARISGVTDVELVPGKDSNVSQALNWVFLLLAFAFITIGLVSFDGIFNKNGTHLTRRAAILIAVLSIPAGSGLLVAHTRGIGVEGGLGFAIYIIALNVLGVIVASKLNRKSPNSAGNAE